MTEANDLKIGAILLAAGGSSRLGKPKQLLEFQGRTLIRRSAEMLTASVCSPVVVVLGAELETCLAELKENDISICLNEKWSDGMSTSIRSGLNKILNIEPQLDAVVIALCDQPFVQTEDFDRLIAVFASTGKPIVGSMYADIMGVPALFARPMFNELFALEGDQGARKLIRQHASLVATVEMESAAIDIDTPSNHLKLPRQRRS